MTIEKSKQGKKNRKSGNDFEKKVREDLEKNSWIVDKWTNNVEFGGSEIIKNTKKEYLGVDYSKDYGKLVPSKPKFNPFTHSLMMNKAGFVDFICFRKKEIDLEEFKRLYNNIEERKSTIKRAYEKKDNKLPTRHIFIESNNKAIEDYYREINRLYSISLINCYEVIGVEAKSNGILDKVEKEKCKWLLENNIFSRILIAHKEKEGRKIKVVYEEFK